MILRSLKLNGQKLFSLQMKNLIVLFNKSDHKKPNSPGDQNFHFNCLQKKNKKNMNLDFPKQYPDPIKGHTKVKTPKKQQKQGIAKIRLIGKSEEERRRMKR